MFDLVKGEWMCDFDDAGSIGRRYRRQDEVGTPFCVTVDFDSLDDAQVTVRERDSMAQDRLPIDGLVGVPVGAPVIAYAVAFALWVGGGRHARRLRGGVPRVHGAPGRVRGALRARDRGGGGRAGRGEATMKRLRRRRGDRRDAPGALHAASRAREARRRRRSPTSPPSDRVEVKTGPTTALQAMRRLCIPADIEADPVTEVPDAAGDRGGGRPGGGRARARVRPARERRADHRRRRWTGGCATTSTRTTRSGSTPAGARRGQTIGAIPRDVGIPRGARRVPAGAGPRLLQLAERGARLHRRRRASTGSSSSCWRTSSRTRSTTSTSTSTVWTTWSSGARTSPSRRRSASWRGAPTTSRRRC